jgi:hypothetical protein
MALGPSDMPHQETFLEQSIGDKRIEVVKTYDEGLAREAFDEMSDAARAFLWNALKIEEAYDASDIPAVHSADGDELLWDSLLEDAREDGNHLSFFIVNEQDGSSPRHLYVSSDWPSAEKYANTLVKQPF